MYRILILLTIVLSFACKDGKKKEFRKIDPGATVSDSILKEEENFFVKDPENPSDGERVQIYRNGLKKSQGFYKNGKRDGKWKAWYSNGVLWSECDFKDGMKHGYSAVYFRSGVKRYEGEYYNDKRVGVWKYYDESGALIKEEKAED